MTTNTLDFPVLDEAPAAATPARPGPPAKPTAIADSIAVVQGEVAKFDQIESGLRAIESAHPKNVIVAAIETPSGMRVAEAGWRAYRNPRLDVEKARKAAKAPVLSLGKAIDAFAGDLEARLRAGEDHYKAQIDAEAERREVEKAEAARVEAKRISGHQANIATIRSYLTRCQGLSAARIAAGVAQLEAQTYTDGWDEFAVPAANAQCETLEAMCNLLTTTRAAEAAAAAMEAQRMENERQAAALAEQQRLQDEAAAELARQRKDAADRIAAMERNESAIAEIHAAATGHEKADAATLAEAIMAVRALSMSRDRWGQHLALARNAQETTLEVLGELHEAAMARGAENTAERDAAERLKSEAKAEAAGIQQAIAPMLAQDECRPLSMALASKPDAPQHAKEAAAAIAEDARALERVVMLGLMHEASKVFYQMAVQTGCHPFIEFTGLINEYIKICGRAHNEGIDFPTCNKHSGHQLPMQSFEVVYVNEKLECIFTGRSVIAPTETDI